MTNKTNIGIGLIAIVALVLSFTAVTKTPVNTTTEVTKNVGSVTGPDLYSPYWNVNGVRTWYAGQALAKSTTTPCSLKSPASTSTLTVAGIQIGTASSTAITIRVATSSTAYATTTTLNSYALASGALGSFNQNSTSSQTSVMAPNTYLVFSLDGIIGADSTKLNGTCFAEWVQF